MFLHSYVLIEMDLTIETQYFVNNVPGVTSFVGPGRKPERLRAVEVERILGQIDSGKTREAPVMKFAVGDKVKVIDGPFTDFAGMIEETNPLKSKVKVTVSIFGRPTPVELDVLQIEMLKSTHASVRPTFGGESSAACPPPGSNDGGRVDKEQVQLAKKK